MCAASALANSSQAPGPVKPNETTYKAKNVNYRVTLTRLDNGVSWTFTGINPYTCFGAFSADHLRYRSHAAVDKKSHFSRTSVFNGDFKKIAGVYTDTLSGTVGAHRAHGRYSLRWMNKGGSLGCAQSGHWSAKAI